MRGSVENELKTDSIRSILKTEEMQGVLVTHEHIDHISGLGVIARRYGLPIYATQGTIDAILNTKSVGK